MDLTVMSFNIHKGKHAFFNRDTLAHIRDFLAAHSVDVVMIQEVIGADPKKRDFDQVAYLAEGISSTFCYGPNLLVGDYHHGNAILSRYPIERWKNEDLTLNRFEKRGILGATIALPQDKRAEVFSCHLNLLRGSRMTQFRKMIDLIEMRTTGFNGPLFLGGDFNDWLRDANTFLLEHGWQEIGRSAEVDREHFLTYPAWWPQMALDRIYYRNANLVEASTASFGDLGLLSDHLPILAKFHLD